MGLEIVAIIGAATSIISTLIGTIYTVLSKKMKEKDESRTIVIKTKNGAKISMPLNATNEEELKDIIKTLTENDTITSIEL